MMKKRIKKRIYEHFYSNEKNRNKDLCNIMIYLKVLQILVLVDLFPVFLTIST